MTGICPSGDWDCLNEHLAELYRLLLTKIDNRSLEGINALNSSWKASTEETLTELNSRLGTVESTTTNLSLLYNELNAAFIEHTGLPASSGHNGL